MHFKRIILAVMVCIQVSLAGISQSSSGKDLYSEYNTSNFRNEVLFKEAIVFKNIDYKRINAVVFYLTNEIREKHKLSPLIFAPELERSATMHAKDMVSGNFFSHINETDPKKKTPNDRAKLCNVSNPFLAENIIEGYGLIYKSYETVYERGPGQFSKTPEGDLIKAHTYLSFGETLISGWMNSKDHRKNILAKEALQLGCGAAYFANPDFNNMPSFMVVQNFQWYKPITQINR